MYWYALTSGFVGYPIESPSGYAFMVSGCAYIGSEYGFLPRVSFSQMSDDHQSLLVGRSRKPSVTFGATSLFALLFGRPSFFGGTLSTKPGPTGIATLGGGAPGSF